MPLRDHIRRWLDTHRDQPLTLTEEQREMVTRAMVTRAIHRQLGTVDLTRHIFASNADFEIEIDRGFAVDAERIAEDFRRVGRDIADVTGTFQLQLGFDGALSPDTLPRDPRPDYCWRCDALPATDPIIGLCGKCTTDLKAGD